jgi:N12 class adenine-specific DNA methylase
MSFSDLVKRANEEKKKEEEKKVTTTKSSFGDLIKKAYSGSTPTQFTADGVNRWSTSLNSVSKKAYDYLSSDKYRKADTELANEVDKYLSDADFVLQYIRANKNNISDYESLYSSVIEAKNALSNYSKSIHGLNDFFSQFETEDDYNKAVIGWLNEDVEITPENAKARQERYKANLKRIEELEKNPLVQNHLNPYNASQSLKNADTLVNSLINSGMNVEEMKANKDALIEEYDRLIAENNQYKRTQYGIDSNYIPITDEVTNIASNRNFTNASMDELWKYDAVVKDIKARNLVYDYDGNMVDAGGRVIYEANHPVVKAMRENNLDSFYDSVVGDKLGMYLSASQDDLDMAYERLINGGNADDTWAILMNEGETKAWKELTSDEITRYYYKLNTEGKSAAYKYLKDMSPILTRRATKKRAKELGNATWYEQILNNIASVPMSLVGNVVGTIGDFANLISGNELDPYDAAHALTNDASAIRQDTAQDIDEALGGASIPWLDFSFGDAYSAMMSIGDSVVSSFIPGGSAILGLGAAQSTMKDIYDRGGSTSQMLASGIMAGVAESFFEKFSIGELNKIKNMDKASVKGLVDIFVRGAIMGGVEASEEMATEIVNTLTDSIVMGSQSNWTTPEEFLKNVLNAGIGGFLSGGATGSGATMVKYIDNKIANSSVGKEIIKNGSVENLQNIAKINYSDNKAITKLNDKVTKKATKQRVGALAREINQTDHNTMVADLVKRGLSEDESERVAYFTEKIMSGNPLTESEESEMLSITDKLPDVVDMSEAGTEENVKTASVAENASIKENATEAKFEAPETVEVVDAKTATTTPVKEDISQETEEDNTVSLEEASTKYGAQAKAMIHTYVEGQDVAQYDKAYQIAYDMGRSGVSLSYVKQSEATAYLSEAQKELAYEAGKAASDSDAKSQYDKIKNAATGKTGRKKGTVKGEGVTIADLKKSFNDTQNKAYKILSTFAEATGVDIVLYKSEANEDGDFEGAQGSFDWSDDKLRVDINAGLKNIKSVDELAKYAMVRTFSHEFIHFIEKYNPIWYNEFRKVVFDTLTERGENVNDLIETKQALNPGMTYEKASREVVAEAMTDILPDSRFVETLANNHKNIFETLLEKLKEFLEDIKAYFNTIGQNTSREANALKEQTGEAVHYVENIVQLFDKVAAEAVENYQKTVAFEEKAEKIDSIDTLKAEKIATKPDKGKSATQILRDMGGKSVSDNMTDVTDLFFPELAKTNVKESSKDAYDSLSETLLTAYFIKENGLNFAIRGNDKDGYYGTIKTQVKESVGGVPIENAFDRIYRSAEFKTKEEAVEDLVAVARNNKLLESKEEVKPNVENVDNRSTVQQSISGRQEDSSVLEGIQAGDVQGDVQRGDSLGNSVERGQQTVRDDVRSDATGTSRGSGVGDSELGDLRRDDELTSDDSPVYDVYDNSQSVIDSYKKIDTSAGVEKAKKEYGLSDDEAFSVYTYVIGNAYEITRLQRAGDGAEWSEWETIVADNIREGLLKHPTYSGRTYRNLDFDSEFDKDNYEPFILENEVGKEVTLKAFTSASKNPNGYPSTGKKVVHLVIDGVSARDISETFNPGQAEVIYLPGVKYKVTKVTIANDGFPLIYGEEIVASEIQEHSGSITSERYLGGNEGVPEGQGDDLGGVRQDGGSDKRGSGSGKVEIHESGTLSADKERLHEEVTTQIAQQSTEKPKGRNFVIGDTLDLPSGEKARYKANIEAIKLVKQLEAEGRYATEAEQVILSKYVGWGGLANAFDERKADWSKEYKELKELLTKEEYELARGSTLNAHYTDISVIKAMYDGLKQLGFNGGRMIEPSSGVGNFVGAMPADMSAKVKSWTIVELDNITGLIAKYLYPNADVRIQGFEKLNIPNNYMDVAISNVPFGNYPITDKAYPKKVTSAIHNYFFAKSIDKVRPGGIVMFITSSYTMNSKDETVRRYIMQRADLLGAIRLPDSAFKGNAGTEVVTDIIILKKRAANTAYEGEDFVEASYKYINGYNGAYINNYFDSHPEMVLGTASMDGGMYRGASLTYKALEGKGSLADQIREAFNNIKGKMDYPAQLSPEKTNFAVERADKKIKADGYVAKNGKIYQNKDGELVEQSVTPKVAERIKGMLEIRDAAKALMNAQQQGLKETEIKKARTNLNKLYDAFVKKNGFLNSPSNKSVFRDDPDNFFVFALENWNPDDKKATKADIFSKNTIAPNRTVTSAKDVREGLIVSVNQTGGVDTALIARLTGKTEADVNQELLDSRLAFKNRDGVLETAETYLSGNVRAKLRDAEALAPIDSDYEKNIEALKAVMPEDVSYQDIFVNPGTPWIPSSVYSDFAAYMLGTTNSEWRQSVDVTRNAETGNFTVELKNNYLKFNAQNTQKWGTSRRTFLDLFDAMLNSKSVIIKDKLDDGSFVVNKDATAAANEKIENITKEFQEWLWKDEARRTELATLYNEVFNSIVTPKYNGDNLTVNGANAIKPLRPHQRNAVQRVISSGGNTLLAHKVGAGKTYEMAAAAMKLKELGLVKKPMFAVPKSLVAQWGNEFIDFFPTAKLLVAEASDFTSANRKVFMNRIANGNYDAVIVSYEQFEKLPVSDDFTRELYQEQIDSVIAAIEEAKAEKGAKAMSVKDLEKKRKSLQAKIDKLTDKAKDEGNIDFEELGVDSLFIDEAHNFKNLFYTTSMTNVSGLGNKDGSKRAFDLYTKVRYLQKLNGGKGIVFATATPVMNSMSEMYIMQKYLQPDLLEQLGLNTFDAWAKQFGEVVNGVEIKPSGQGYRVKQSFSRFKNMSELQLLFRNFADVLTDIPGLKIPKMKGGAVNVVVCEPGEFQKNFMKELEKRADNIKNVDPSVDNMLKITSDGRKISYTQRMIDPSLPYEEGCKIYRCADNVVRVYNDSKAVKGTQIVFLDMATPKGKSKTETTEVDDDSMDMESARLYDDLKSRLVQNGIPAKEIAFIHDADTDQKKKKLFADVNEGKVRVLIGSTGKMGVGMNAQKRIVAIHHLDAPWRPGDVEQRNGRAFRQGNINDEVENFTYVTEGSFDARLWDILERKQNFINQVMNGESVGRETEDTGEVTLSAAEVKALASGSPLIMEQVQLDTDIKKLESLYRAHQSAVRAARERLSHDKGQIELLERMIELGKSDMLAIKDTYSEGKFSITVGKQKFTEKKDAGVALMAEATAKATEENYTSIGSFAGFDVRVIKSFEGIKGLIVGKQGYSFNTYPNNTTFMINHLISVVESITEKVNMWNAQLTETKKDMAEQEKLINEPFAKQAELDEKRKRYNEVMEILNPKEEQSLDSVAEDTVQEQSREYLEDEQYQQRTDTLTDREVLELASNEIKVSDLNQAERDALTIFQDRLSKLKDLQEERAEQGRLYKEHQFGTKVDRAAASSTLNRMHILDNQIKKATADVLTVEEKEVLKRVLSKARKVVEVQERQHGQEILNRWRDRRNNAAAIKKYRDRLRGDVDELTNWIIGPNNKDIAKHVPDVLKNSVIPFLSSINFMSKRSLKGGDATVSDKEFIKRIDALKSAIKTNIDVYGMYSGYNDLPPDFMESLENFRNAAQSLLDKSTGEFIINQMTSGELKELSKVVRTLKKYIMQINRFHNNAMYQHVYEAGDNSIDFLKELDNAGSHTNSASNFVFWQQIRPAYAFERFGEGGQAIYDGLRKGQSKLAFNTKEIESFAKKAYTEKEVKAWEKDIKEFNLGRDIVRIPVSYLMSFYELSKDPEALEHINGEGIRVATYTRNGKKISDVGHILTVGEFNQLIGSLTDRQREVADSLQKYMAEQGGKWGNYVSVARFGEELFTNKNYFPINSDGRHLSATAEEHPSAAALYALLNMSFTKSRKEGANNRIVIYSIFDVFANHMASMAQYNAMALPILDALKWFNYQQVFIDDEGNKTVIASVREQMSRVYGVPEETKPGSGKQGYAESFIVNIIKSFNGTAAQGTPYDSFGLKWLHRYNVAQVSYNLRVVVQQPLAITRAGMLVNYTSIIKGMKLKPAAIKKNIEEMQSYSGIAAWKSLGFYDVNISRGLAQLIKHDSNWLDKIGDVGMWGAEKADILTWAAIWSAAKEEVIKKQHLTSSSEGFYEAVTKLFEDIIYKTQVVDSVLTKNEFMRDKGAFARFIGSFMSEPTTNASMAIDAIDKYHLDIKRGMSRQQAWQKNGKMIGRTIYVFAVGAVLLAAIQAAADALRDDDEYEELDEKWLEAFGGNLVDELMPFNKLPIMADFYDLAKEIASIFGVDTYGNPPQSVFMQWYDSLVKGIEIIHDKATDEDTNYTYYGGIYKLLQAISGMSGMPMASATREIITAWNNTVGAMAPSLKVKTYEPSELSEIKYAYVDGYLTYEEAVEHLLEKGLVDTENEAYFIIQGWEVGEGYSRYDKIYDVILNGGNFDAAMEELTSRGYSDKDVLSQVKSQIGEWYQSGKVSKSQAVEMLTKYSDLESDEITATINKWSSVVVTGIKYEDIDDEFMNGNITASRAIEMFVRYGSMTREKATEKVTVLEFVKEHPKTEGISYSAVNGYNTYCEPYGVPAETYYEAWVYKNTLSGEVKESMMTYINSLSLSARQKDSMYYAFGWAESKLWEAPWR